MRGVSDLTRIERQQYVVIQLIKELKDFQSVNELNNFINAQKTLLQLMKI